FDDWYLLVTGSAGTFSFTALILILSFADVFRYFYLLPSFFLLPHCGTVKPACLASHLYFDMITTGLTGVSASSMISSFGVLELKKTYDARMEKLVRLTLFLTFMGSLTIFPLILYHFTTWGFAVVAIYEIVILFFFGRFGGFRQLRLRRST
ncbi:MAG: hypothetical protein M1368_09035, partial [Thaumarchaeota archaeon]|nr:hypothetical protein [Nitrososphaerota archaeon]